MVGVQFIEEAHVEAGTGHMLVTFISGGDAFRFRLPADVALRFRRTIMEDGWAVCCTPSAEVVTLSAVRARKRREGR